MSKRVKRRKKLTEEEIDQAAIEQANDDSAWERPIRVGKKKTVSFSLPADLTARAAFLAQLHRETSLEDWLARIIRERVELEELAYGQAKRDLTTKMTA